MTSLIPAALLAGIFFACLCSTSIEAAEGPGVPNAPYSPTRTGEILSVLDPGKAISATALHRGYLFVPLGADHGGGVGDGAFAFYDVSNPSAPQKVMDSRDLASRYHNPATADYVGNWAELHHLPMSGDLLMVSEKRNGSAGFSIFDVGPLYDDDPATHPRTISRYSYPGVTSPTNYDGYAFAMAWQGNRYAYAPTGANGLFVVDTADLQNPTLLAHRTRSALGNITLRAAVPIGNLLILYTSAVETSFQARIYNISDPANPVQIGSFGGPQGYMGFVYGGSFYGGGAPLLRHDFSNPANVVTETLNANPIFDRPEYGYGKDGDLFVGHYPGATKWDLNGTSTTKVADVLSGIVDDHAFLNPLGNLILLCSDHNNTRKMMIGIPGPDKDVTPPEPLFMSPQDGSTGAHLKSRIGISFSDVVDPMSLGASTMIVRKFGTATALPGSYSAMAGIVNFVPQANLEPDTTYEVILAAGGVKDQVGNAPSADTLVGRFSTGTSLQSYTVKIDPVVPKAVGSTAAFSLTVTGNIGTLEHSWDFGDGSAPTAFATVTTASHLYSTPGNFNVSVRSRVTGSSISSTVNGAQVIHLLVTAAVPSQSATIAVDPDRAVVWNVNPDNDSVTAIDALTYARLYEIPVGDHPRSLAFGPSDTLWVTNKGSSSLSVINRATGTLIQTHTLSPGSSPHGIVIDGTNAYVTLEAKGQLAKINTVSGSLVATLDVGPWPRSLVLDRQRARLWVARFISPDNGGRIGQVDLASFTALPVTTLAPVMAPDSLTNGRGIPNYLGAFALSPDGSQLYVPSKKDNIFRGTLRDGQDLTFEHTVRSMATNVDPVTGLENPARRIDLDNNDFATAVAFSPLGNQAFFTTSGSGTVWVADAYDPANSYTFDSGGMAPDGLAFNADGSRLFVHHFMDRSVTVFRSNVACASICGAAPQVAKVSTVTNEQLPANVLLGKQLFYDSSDPRLAQEGYMSCASCHLDGGHDGRVWDFTSLGEGLRNTIDLTGRGQGHGPLHWSANFDEAHDFEGQIRGLGNAKGLMTDEAFFHGNRSQSLGEPKANLSVELDALAAYLGSLTTAGRSPHRQPDGQLTAAAQAGRTIFQQENCASCHGGSAFSDSVSLARHDVGTLSTDSGKRLGGSLEGLDTPTLRGLWKTAPYLHDGSAASVREVITSRDLSGRHGNLFHRSSVEIDQLVDYLLSIDDLETSAPGKPSGDAPSITVPAAQTSAQHHAVSVPLQATGSGVRMWNSLAMPPGLFINPTTGVISGSASAVGIYTVRVGIRDVDGRTSEVAFPWSVTPYRPDPNLRRYVKLVALSSLNGQPFTSVAEFNLQDGQGDTLDRGGWKATANSQETIAANNAAFRAIDGNTSTLWHNEWQNGPDVPHPHELVIDLGQPTVITAFRYLPRSDGTNGHIANWHFYWSDDGVNWGQPVAQGTFAAGIAERTVALSGATGGITREYWAGISGDTVVNLMSHASYPGSPTSVTTPSSFLAPSDQADNYGMRIHGYLVPPTNGDYRFWIASDDSSQLWFGDAREPSSAALIASVSTWTDPQQWDKTPSQQSVIIPLKAGVRYYIRALHKENSGPDHLAVAWQGPGITRQVIPGSALIPWDGFSFNAPPVIGPGSPTVFPVQENAFTGTQLGTIQATDWNFEDALHFQIVAGNDGGLFALDPATGLLTVAGAIDYESSSFHRLQIVVSDSAAPAASVSVEITIPVSNVIETNGEHVAVTLTSVGGTFGGYGNPSLIGFNADPDGDGRPNAIELLHGTDPASPDTSAPVRYHTVVEDGKTYPVYEFEVAADAGTRLVFRCQGSGGLEEWNQLTATPELLGESDGIRTYRVRDDVAIEDAGRRFIRFSVDPDQAIDP